VRTASDGNLEVRLTSGAVVDPAHALAVDRDRRSGRTLEVEQAAREAGELVAIAVSDHSATSSMSVDTGTASEAVELADQGANGDASVVGWSAASRLPSSLAGAARHGRLRSD